MSGFPDSQENEPQRSTLWHQFTQQRLKAWQPIFSPRWMIPIHLACGVAFLGVGIGLLAASRSVAECKYDYTEEDVDDNSVGSFEIELEMDMESPLLVYYQLDGYHQNHRRYVKSRDDDQLKGADAQKYTEAELSTCKPWITTGSRVNYPCGLIARSVFNDNYVILAKRPDDSDWQKLLVKSDAKTITWPTDTEGKFRNLSPEAQGLQGEENQVSLNMWIIRQFPPVTCEQKVISDTNPWRPTEVALRNETRQITEGSGAQTVKVEVADCRDYTSSSPTCNFLKDGKPFTCKDNYELVTAPDWGIENGHFINWMRIAGLPHFRKLWGKVDLDEPLRKGSRLKVYFKDNFPVREYKGRKAIVISTTSALGGRNDSLGIGYIFVGCWCLMFGTFFIFRKTRQLGDVSLLSNPEG